MTSDTAEDRAVAAARSRLGLPADEPAQIWRIRRLRADAGDFFLVVFGQRERAIGVAAVDCETSDVRESVRLSGRAAHSIMSADAARALAGVDDASAAELVWEPSDASRSALYPLWQLQCSTGLLWVDAVRGVVSRSLESDRGGR